MPEHAARSFIRAAIPDQTKHGARPSKDERRPQFVQGSMPALTCSRWVVGHCEWDDPMALRNVHRGADSPGRGEADLPLEDIDLLGLDRGRSIDPSDLLHDADQLAPFFGGEPLVEEIRE